MFNIFIFAKVGHSEFAEMHRELVRNEITILVTQQLTAHEIFKISVATLWKYSGARVNFLLYWATGPLFSLIPEDNPKFSLYCKICFGIIQYVHVYWI